MAENTSRLKRASYNVVILAIYQMTVFVCNLILPRFILTAYGSEYNGIISSITQFLNFISILRLGVAGATRVELYKSLASDNTNQTSAIIRATEVFMRKVACIFAAYLVAMAVFYPLVVRSRYSYLEIGSLVLVMGVGTFAQYFFGITYSTLLQADQRLYVYNVIQIAATVVNTLLACTLIRLGFSIQVMKLGSSLVFTASPLLLNWYVTRRYHLNKKAAPDNTALRNRGSVIAHSIANIVHDNTDVVVLTLLTDVKTVSVYAVYNLVLNGLKQLMTIFTSGLESAFGSMWIKKEIDKMYYNLRMYEFFICSFVCVVFSCAAVLILPFVRVYTKGVTDVNYIIPVYAALAVTAQAVYCIRMPYITLVQAAGHYRQTRNGAFMEAFINIVISVALTWKIGLVGVVIGTLCANLFRTVQYSVYLSRNLLPRPIRITLWRMGWTLANCLVSVAVCEWLMSFCLGQITSWGSWCAGGILSFAVSSSITLASAWLFYRADLRGTVGIVKRILNRKGR